MSKVHKCPCIECHNDAPRSICLQCNGDAMSSAAENAAQAIYAATHELFTGLDDCRVTVPDLWHDKPFARFTHDRDPGDSSVGIGPRDAWTFAADQSGTVLADLIAERLRAEAA